MKDDIESRPVHILMYGATYEEWHDAKIQWRKAFRSIDKSIVLISGWISGIDEAKGYFDIRKDVDVLCFVSHQRPRHQRQEAETLALLLASEARDTHVFLGPNGHLSAVFKEYGVKVSEDVFDVLYSSPPVKQVAA